MIDPHTAVAACVYKKYREDTGDADTKTVIVSTASPFKFARSVTDAIGGSHEGKTDFELCDELSAAANVGIPQAVQELRGAPVRHDTVCEAEEMPAVVKRFLGIA